MYKDAKWDMTGNVDGYSGKRMVSLGPVMPDVHCHDSCEVHFIISGNTVVYVNGKNYEACPNSLFIYGSTDLHRSIPDPTLPYDRYVLVFDPLYARKLSSGDTDLLEWYEYRDKDFSNGLRLTEEQARSLIAYLDKTCDACRLEDYGRDLLQRASFCELMVNINLLYRQAQPETQIPHEKGLQRIRPALRYIHENLNADLHREQLAKLCFMSVRHMGNLFRMSTGFTVNEYITMRRILNARELLKEDISVAKAADLSGFNDLSHFGRVFRRLVGVSPRKYTSMMRK